MTRFDHDAFEGMLIVTGFLGITKRDSRSGCFTQYPFLSICQIHLRIRRKRASEGRYAKAKV